MAHRTTTQPVHDKRILQSGIWIFCKRWHCICPLHFETYNYPALDSGRRLELLEHPCSSDFLKLRAAGSSVSQGAPAPWYPSNTPGSQHPGSGAFRILKRSGAVTEFQSSHTLCTRKGTHTHTHSHTNRRTKAARPRQFVTFTTLILLSRNTHALGLGLVKGGSSDLMVPCLIVVCSFIVNGSPGTPGKPHGHGTCS